MPSLPVGQPLRGLPLDQILGYFWEGKYFGHSRVSFSKLDRKNSKPTTRSRFGEERLESRLELCLCFESLAIFRVGAYSSLLLPAGQSLCELQLLTGDG